MPTRTVPDIKPPGLPQAGNGAADTEKFTLSPKLLADATPCADTRMHENLRRTSLLWLKNR